MVSGIFTKFKVLLISIYVQKIVQIKSNKQIKEPKLGGVVACICIAVNLDE